MSGKQHSLTDIAAQLLCSSKLLIISHYNPDADAYGSSCGLTILLRSIGKTVTCVNESPNSERYFFIPEVTSIINQIPQEDFDTVVVCDCGDIKRVGDSFKPVLEALKNVINIDHHASNTMFGDLNYIDEKASSTSEMILRIAHALKVRPSVEAAQALLAGLVADTGSFRYASTTADTLRAGAELVDLGAKPAPISRALFEERSLAAVLLQSYLMSNLKLHAEGRVAEINAYESDVTRFKATLEDLDGLVEEARGIAGVLVSVAIRQDGEIWRISMRSKDSRIDLSKIAAKFGGGGHKAAAAFRAKRTLEEIRSALLPELEAAVKSI